MKFFFTFFCVFIFCMAHSQLLNWSPDFITEQSQNATITADATKGNQGLLNHAAGDVYVHIGIITTKDPNPGKWQHVQSTWATTPDSIHAVSTGTNKWTFTIKGSVRSFFKVTDASEKILKIAILFRSGDGNQKLANSDGSDMYVPVYDTGLQTRITQPYKQPTFYPTLETLTYVAGNNVPVTAVSSTSAALQILFNGNVITNTTGTSITASPVAVSGNNQIIVKATAGNRTKYDTVSFFINTPVVVKDLPPGVRDGINYGADGTSATLVLYAPYKTRAAVIGEFNNWTRAVNSEMFRTPDGSRYWINITGLQKDVEYAYQYVVDDTLKVADMFAEKILDPANDSYISAETYPNLKPYPAGQTGIVSILHPGKATYNWQVANFSRPDKRNLVIYELLVRDFVAKHDWKTVQDTLSYLKRLGINAIEVMPFNEFEGNISWGYNPDYFFAPDKYYGTDVALKQFIDECHKQGIALIMDIAMNHAFGSSPTVQLYWDAANNRPAANNPWHNQQATHPASVGYDFNHESAATQELVQRVVEHWLTDYKIDGFRWDLSKGFTQTVSGDSYDLWAKYDASRVQTWKRIYDTMQQTVKGSYCILEHFADNSEETELSNYGMLLWGNENYNYNQTTMGYVDGSDFGYGIYTARNWQNPNLVTYMESHDEERLMFKNEQYGNSKKDGSYNIKNIPTGLKRNEMAAAFWAMQPAPKMLWQFGELGYDYSINTCENGTTISNDCRLSLKPIRWDYQNDANRVALFNVYSRLFALRNHAAYLPAFTAPKDSVSWSTAGKFKWEKVNSAPLHILVVGNMDTASQTGSVSFAHTGIWYDYLAGTTLTVNATTQNFTLAAGEYHVYIDQNAAAVLPLQFISFSGIRQTTGININWTTANESNLLSYTVMRSENGKDFTEITSVTASNTAQHTYHFEDRASTAVNNSGFVYYKLKATDKAGNTTYSSIIRVDPPATDERIVLYPNPVKTGVVNIQLGSAISGKVQISIADATGKIMSFQSTEANGFSSRISINVSSLATGVYNVKIVNNGSSTLQKLVIQQ